ncbi:tRNA preQ1(34) S-adenosylmethionine ribosyltransferase-isomerase QueA [Woeseia oceani]|uniref:S-adenosylmethionine:tRNA ribosyltransferase-isomerase n=1 Tax=Woeseia oceani TaxID=1548547 RepID=A0A193LEC3_9GAMM|nr:tRNA preQ1(34) S-adenosylmethionine ribosyltransferase-isomerase QueA [Woeseia oceani]ANO50801.1 tRNA preQ1(34) S-adenosylmethionine ribosyltransferase-isomerase QueA [Woeseia oceani]
MQLADFNYDLPDALIARYPEAERRASRLLLVDPASNSLSDRRFAELPTLLHANDLLVFNDTRVIKARLVGSKASGGRVEILVERQLDETDVLAHVRASKSPKAGGRLLFADNGQAEVLDRDGALFHLRFDRPVAPYLDAFGEMPLPPYLERRAEASDTERYQTVYARQPGAVAAPTAGLHFDQAMLAETAAKGVQQTYVTLHVGAGTFQNLRAEQVAENRLHSERVELSEQVVRAVAETRERQGRVIAVGTTSVRALEFAARDGQLKPCSGETDLFIRPGYRWHVVDAMLTNFHLPQSSLLMLVAAFAGTRRVLGAYQHAIEQRYRFFSYGDAMLLTGRGADQ